MASQQVVCIDGLIGAGKSTITRRLKKHYPCFEEPIEKWFLLPDLYRDMKTFATPFQFQVLLSQYEQFQSFKNIQGTLVVERCPWTSKNVFAQMLIDDKLFDETAIETFNNFYGRLAYDVDHFIFLKLDAEEAFERVKRRDRFAEQKLTFDYLEKLQVQYEQSFKKLPQSMVTYVDGSNTVDIVENQVVNILRSLRPPSPPHFSPLSSPISPSTRTGAGHGAGQA